MPQSIADRRRPGQADIKVICAGLPRCGGLSMRMALMVLLHRPCYHMNQVFQRPKRDPPIWQKAYEQGLTPEEWDELLAPYAAVVDSPACDFVKELADLYPEAKVVVLTRNPEEWYRSMLATKIWKQPTLKDEAARAWYSLCFPYQRALFKLMDTIFSPLSPAFRGATLSPDILTRYVAQTISFFRVRGEEDRVLLYDLDASRGWTDICAHLNLDVPHGVPWPNSNWSGVNGVRGNENAAASAVMAATADRVGHRRSNAEIKALDLASLSFDQIVSRSIVAQDRAQARRLAVVLSSMSGLMLVAAIAVALKSRWSRGQ